MGQKIEAAGHAVAGGSFFGWLAGVLPVAATAVTFIWFSILIVEKFTGKQFVEIVRCAREKLYRFLPHR
jgi:hypothetical protein